MGRKPPETLEDLENQRLKNASKTQEKRLFWDSASRIFSPLLYQLSYLTRLALLPDNSQAFKA